jgi:hypothetical protein
VLVTGMLPVIVAVGLILTQSPLVFVSSNSVPPAFDMSVGGGTEVCQSHEDIPQDVVAVRLASLMAIGPTVNVRVLQNGLIAADGSRSAGWRGRDVTVPVSRLPHPLLDSTVCFAFGPTSENVGLVGSQTPSTVAAAVVGAFPLAGRARIEYLRRDTASWWSLLLPVARRMGLGHAASGTWVVLLVTLLMLAVAGVASFLVISRLP